MRTAIYSTIDPAGISTKNQQVSTDDFFTKLDAVRSDEFIHQYKEDMDRGLIDPVGVAGFKQPDIPIPDNGEELNSGIIAYADGETENDFWQDIYGEQLYLKNFVNSNLPMSDFRSMEILKQVSNAQRKENIPAIDLLRDIDYNMDPYLTRAVNQGLENDISSGADLFDETSKTSKRGIKSVLTSNTRFDNENKLFKTAGRLKIEGEELKKTAPDDSTFRELGEISNGERVQDSGKPEKGKSPSTPVIIEEDEGDTTARKGKKKKKTKKTQQKETEKETEKEKEERRQETEREKEERRQEKEREKEERRQEEEERRQEKEREKEERRQERNKAFKEGGIYTEKSKDEGFFHRLFSGKKKKNKP